MDVHSKSTKNRILVLFCISAIGLTVANSSGKTRFQAQTYPLSKIQAESLRSYFTESKSVILNPMEVYRLTKGSEKSIEIQLTVEQGQIEWDLTLEKNDLLAANYVAFKTTSNGREFTQPGEVNTYKGHLKNDPASEVRLTITEDRIEGFIFTNGKRIFIEPLENFVAGTSKEHFVIYDARDVIQDQVVKCGATQLSSYDEILDNQAVTKAAQIASFNLEVATDADFEYFQKFGQNTNSRILDILNQVEGLYINFFNLEITVVAQHVFETDNDPYVSTEAGTILNEFRTQAPILFNGVNRDVAHLWTGKNIDGGTIGIAYRNGVCRTSSGVGVSQNLNGVVLRTALTAHEIGHNLGLPHVADTECNGDGPVMCPSIQGGDPFFLQSSIDIVMNQTLVNRAACLSDGFLASPGQLQANAVSQSQIDLSWQDYSDSEDGFVVERALDLNGVFEEIGTVAANETRYSIIDLKAGTMFFYRVSAIIGNAKSNYSNVINASTRANEGEVEIIGSWLSEFRHSALPANNRVLFYFAHVEHEAPTISLNSVVYGGQPMTKILEASEGTDYTAYTVAFMLNEIGISAASGDEFVPTWSAQPTRTPGFSSVLLANVNQAGPIAASASIGVTGSSNASALSLTTLPGDLVLAAGTSGESGLYALNNGFVEVIEHGLTSSEAVVGFKRAIGMKETPSVFQAEANRQAVIGFVVQADKNKLPTGIANSGDTAPDRFALFQAYPNPFNPFTSISFNLPAQSDISVRVYNQLGQEVRTLFKGEKSAGTHRLRWNGANNSGELVASGVYIYRLESPVFTESKRVVFLK